MIIPKHHHPIVHVAEDIKKKWQEYTEELCKQDLHDEDNRDGVIIYLEQTSWNVKSNGP